jgi:hypothetical protein
MASSIARPAERPLSIRSVISIESPITRVTAVDIVSAIVTGSLLAALDALNLVTIESEREIVSATDVDTTVLNESANESESEEILVVTRF